MRPRSRRYARIATILLQIVRHSLSSQRADGQSRPVTGDALLLQYVLRMRSGRSVTELTARRARQMLAGWATGQDAAGSRRDGAVRAALDAGPGQERGSPADRHGADHDRPHRRCPPGLGTGPAMTGISAVRVAIARPYALGIPGRARHDARVSGTADMQFRTIAVIPGPSSHDGKSTANAVGPCGPPGFKSPILRCDQQFRPGARSGGTAGFRFPGPLRGHRRNPAARLPHRDPPPRGPCHARNPGRLREHGSGLGLER